jgi:hypothetical protein
MVYDLLRRSIETPAIRMDRHAYASAISSRLTASVQRIRRRAARDKRLTTVQGSTAATERSPPIDHTETI